MNKCYHIKYLLQYKLRISYFYRKTQSPKIKCFKTKYLRAKFLLSWSPLNHTHLLSAPHCVAVNVVSHMTLLPNSCIFVLQINKTIPSTVNVPQRKDNTVVKINIFENFVDKQKFSMY